MGGEMAAAALRDLLTTTKDGDWGRDAPAEGLVPYRVIRGTDFPSVRVGDTTSVTIRYLTDSTVHRRTLAPDDILLETAGGSPGRPTGRSLLITETLLASLDRPATCASFARFLRVDRNRAEPQYVYWFLQYLYASGQMEEHQVQHTGVARFQYTKFSESQEILLPHRGEQRAIAHILGTLDDKIELNRRMNETLEAMARALFKSWFVDFDPIRAKAEGRDPGLAKPLADLFPARLVDSELGEIPEGWEVKKLGELLDLAYGKALKAEDRRDGIIPVYGSNGQVGWHDERFVSGPGIVVGRKGNPGIATWVPTDFFPIDTTFYVVPKSNCRSLAFLFHALRTHDLASLGADSAVPGLNRNLAYMSSQVLPTAPLLVEFERIASALSRRMSLANAESRSIAALRDALLPKLISGELRVNDAERLIEVTA